MAVILDDRAEPTEVDLVVHLAHKICQAANSRRGTVPVPWNGGRTGTECWAKRHYIPDLNSVAELKAVDCFNIRGATGCTDEQIDTACQLIKYEGAKMEVDPKMAPDQSLKCARRSYNVYDQFGDGNVSKTRRNE